MTSPYRSPQHQRRKRTTLPLVRPRKPSADASRRKRKSAADNRRRNGADTRRNSAGGRKNAERKSAREK